MLCPRIFYSILFLAFAAPVCADEFNWTGPYIGVSVGIGSKDNKKTVRYADNSANYQATGTSAAPQGRWRNGMYVSDYITESYYNNRASSVIMGGNFAYGGTNLTSTGSLTEGANGTPNPLVSWLDFLKGSGLTFNGTARAGFNLQFGHLVLGGELDSALMKQVAKKVLGIDEAARINATAQQCYNGCNQTYISNFSSQYEQGAEFSYDASTDFIRTARGRLGFAFGRAMFYASGGVAAAEISMRTSSHAIETADTQWEGHPNGGATADVGQHGSVNQVTWERKKSVTKYGYAVGGGMSYAVMDSIVVNLDGFYYNLGKSSITATDNFGETSYTITDRFRGAVIRSGIEFHF